MKIRHLLAAVAALSLGAALCTAPACSKKAADAPAAPAADAKAADAPAADAKAADAKTADANTADGSQNTAQAPTMLDPANPFAHKSSLPFGVVDYGKLKTEHFKPALEAGMAKHLAEVDAIANNSAEPTFENTIVALEKSGELINRAAMIFSSYTNMQATDEIQKLDAEMSSKLSSYSDAIMLNDKLFQRVDKLYNERASLNLDAESLRLLEDYHQDFVLAGAKLNADQKAELSAMNAEIAKLSTEISQNILAAINDGAVVVDDVSELDGMTDVQIKAAKEAAEKRGLTGKYLVTIQNTSIQPVLKSLNNRDLRRRIHESSLSRCLSGKNDNREKILRVLYLRAKRAELLGFPNHAAYKLANTTAKTVDAVNAMLGGLVAPAVASVKAEAAELQALVDAQGGGFQIESYDWLYYSEQLRKQKYSMDDEALKPYFELQSVVENGVFYAAERLYGLKFVERTDIPKYDPDVRIFEVHDGDKPIALFIGDYYAREIKGGGAWMEQLQSQSHLLGDLPIIENQINIDKPPAGEKALLTYDEVTTLFHEFGHGLHAILSDVKYPKFSGANVPRDYVEFPSQFNEFWASHPEILANYAKHYKTGEPIPKDLLDKLEASKLFNQGYATAELVAVSILDQLWHQMSSAEIAAIKVEDFENVEKSLLKKAGFDLPLVPPRYRTAYFNHIFSHGYDAQYYSYLWSEVLDADAGAWFKEHGLSRENGMHLRQHVLSKGYSVDPMTQYRNFAGRDPSIEPLLKRRGLK